MRDFSVEKSRRYMDILYQTAREKHLFAFGDIIDNISIYDSLHFFNRYMKSDGHSLDTFLDLPQ